MKSEPTLPAMVNLDFVEDLYLQYLNGSTNLPPAWQTYFAVLSHGDPVPQGPRLAPSFPARSLFHPAPAPAPRPRFDTEIQTRQHRADRLVRAYRERGHIQASIDPLNPRVRYVAELDLQYYGFTEVDLDQQLICESLQPEGPVTLRNLVARLQAIYCGSIGFQYLHIDDGTIRHWVQKRIEDPNYWEPVSRAMQLRILTRLTDAVVFEQFLHKKFVGAKSFSLEGGESLIPLLDLAIERASQTGVREIVLGMAHRGRLNVLANIIGKCPQQIFREFEDHPPDLHRGGGDVKYHLGYSSDYATAGGRPVHLSLCFNPSHLEFVNPVVLGRVRAKQDRALDSGATGVMSVMIHGDAAFIGEGIVQETLNLSRLPGYRAGGTLHILINNQIGFTTPPAEGRSTMYATSVAKMLPVPILHVNGESPEAVARCLQLAMDFRHTFQQDVVIDMYCYRRLGHNEGDEPSFTQPLLYAQIEHRRSVREGYLDHLLGLGEVSRSEADEIAANQQEVLEGSLRAARETAPDRPTGRLTGVWRDFLGGPESGDPTPNPETGVPVLKLAACLDRLTTLPADFNLHPKLHRFLEQRRQMALGELPLDWATAEALALTSLAVEGHRVRFSGQDSQRGTFSQRHAVFHDVQNGRTYIPWQHIEAGQARVDILNSPLSESGVLGFEYGYSLECPDGLVVWEAQFGDFVNAAQVILDQFITSGEEKWRRLSGLVLLLPHGLEGNGPEHSSARLERFLEQAAEDNIQIVVPTTPAQYFHVLRRQLHRRWRKPLVILTPKSLLRDPRAVSPLTDFTQGHFQRILPDPRADALPKAGRILLCSGKIYFDLETERSRLGREDVAILRLEQLYPFPRTELALRLKGCRSGTPILWVQEEPENMGAWRYLQATGRGTLPGPFPDTGICRAASTSPATGSRAIHLAEQQALLDRAFQIPAPSSHPPVEISPPLPPAP